MCEETHVFPKLSLLTNHSRLALEAQIIMPRVINLRTGSACRKRQWHSARWNPPMSQAHLLIREKNG